VRRLAPLALLVALLFPPGAGATEQVDGLRAVVVAHLDGVPEASMVHLGSARLLRDLGRGPATHPRRALFRQSWRPQRGSLSPAFVVPSVRLD
jgi:hypothetical protein